MKRICEGCGDNLVEEKFCLCRRCAAKIRAEETGDRLQLEREARVTSPGFRRQ